MFDYNTRDLASAAKRLVLVLMLLGGIIGALLTFFAYYIFKITS